MGQKLKPRQRKLPRNAMALAATLSHGGPMRDRRDRRPKEKGNIRKFIREYED